MAIASISKWLQECPRSYPLGVSLYEQYGDSSTMLKLVKSGSGPFHMAKLKEALEKINERANLVPKPITIPHVVIAQVAAPDKFDQVNYDTAPEQIRMIADNKTEKYARARALFEKIRHMDSQDHRLKAGLELLDLMDEVNDAWSVIDEWKDSGNIREEQKKAAKAEVAALTIQQLIREAKNLPTYITKDQQKLSGSLTDRQRVKVAQRLQEYKDRLKLVKERLGNAV